MISASFYLRPAPPFRLDLTVWALRRMPQNETDRWDGTTYTRVIALDRSLIKLDVNQPDERRIRIEVHADPGDGDPARHVVPLIEKMLGIRRDLRPFYRFGDKDEYVARLVRGFLGFKPPRFPSVYEALINAIACQQISLNVAIALLNRVTRTWGRPWKASGEDLHAFPFPGDLARASVVNLKALGFSASKARAIIAVSQEVIQAGVNLESLARKTDAAVVAELTGLPGIGPWSAEYVMLRGLGRTHIFPGDDSGARRSLQLFLDLKKRPNTGQAAALARTWHPHAGLLYFHFLLSKLRNKGYFS
jgi:DNA-3-methyladenine glycosylase II